MMIKKMIFNQKGTTLIELLAVITTLAMIITTVSFVQTHFLRTYQSISLQAKNNDEVSYFINIFSNKTRNASKVITNNNGAKLVDFNKNTVQFIFDSRNKTVTYINEQGMVFILLENVIVFNATNITNGNQNGITLHISIENGNTIDSYDTSIYSQIY